jgi:proteasome lid subunit RPN8/RPN11
MRVRRAVLTAIVAHARRERPRECCGLLVSDGSCVIEAVEAVNVSETPERRYQVSPVDHLALIRRCRELSTPERSFDVIGAYHSHPRSPARPSQTDHAEASQDFVIVIAGPVAETADVPIRAYRLGNIDFDEIQMTVVD